MLRLDRPPSRRSGDRRRPRRPPRPRSSRPPARLPATFPLFPRARSAYNRSQGLADKGCYGLTPSGPVSRRAARGEEADSRAGAVVRSRFLPRHLRDVRLRADEPDRRVRRVPAAVPALAVRDGGGRGGQSAPPRARPPLRGGSQKTPPPRPPSRGEINHPSEKGRPPRLQT